MPEQSSLPPIAPEPIQTICGKLFLKYEPLFQDIRNWKDFGQYAENLLKEVNVILPTIEKGGPRKLFLNEYTATINNKLQEVKLKL